ncbi:MAG: hypothetical protein HZA54_04160, partial [Planctomycetes bacterium]|nr:hypothetical protein [Planctomycetota bacterium]
MSRRGQRRHAEEGLGAGGRGGGAPGGGAESEEEGSALREFLELPALAWVAAALAAGQFACRVLVNGRTSGFGYDLTFALLLLFPLLLLFLLRPLGAPRLPWCRPAGAVTWIALAFGAVVALSPALAVFPYNAAVVAVSWLGQLAWFFLAAEAGSAPPRLGAILAAALAAIAVQGGLGVYQYFVAFPLLVEEVRRNPGLIPVDNTLQYEFLARLFSGQPFGTLVTRNAWAGLLGIGLPVLLGWAMDRLRETPQARRRTAFALVIAPGLLLAPALGLSGSKGGVGAAAVGLGVLLVLGGWRELPGLVRGGLLG